MNRRVQVAIPSADDATPASDVPRLRDLVGLSMRRIAFASTDLLAERLAAHDCTPTRLTALLVIAEKPGLKLVELANSLGIARSGAVVLVDELEIRGHVKRRPMPGDRRAHSLIATAKGLKALGPLCEVAEECDQQSFGALNQRDHQSLLRLLDKLVA
ncbi:MAG: MarR family transcriptional regulator [Lysobacteraceae bacterium]